MRESEPTKCKGCGKSIYFAKQLMGDGKYKWVPLDPVAPIFEITVDSLGGVPVQCKQDKTAKYMVSHFATCAKANDFSSSKKRDEELF